MISGSLGWAPPAADLKTKTQVQAVDFRGDPGVKKGVKEGKGANIG